MNKIFANLMPLHCFFWMAIRNPVGGEAMIR